MCHLLYSCSLEDCYWDGFGSEVVDLGGRDQGKKEKKYNKDRRGQGYRERSSARYLKIFGERFQGRFQGKVFNKRFSTRS
jgi:hypothetical protein